MKEIVLNNLWKKIQYVIAWVGFIVFGFVVVWIIAIMLANYGKNTDLNQPKKKWVLNKTYQKLIFWYGSILGDLFIIMLIIDLIQMQFTGIPL